MKKNQKPDTITQYLSRKRRSGSDGGGRSLEDNNPKSNTGDLKKKKREKGRD